MYIALRQPCGGGGDCLNPVEHVSCQRESTPQGDQNLQFAPLIKQYDKHPCSFHMRVPSPTHLGETEMSAREWGVDW